MSAPLWPGALAAGLVTALAIAFMWAESEWEVISTTDLDEEVWSTPALAGGLVFVRSNSALYCFFNEEG